MATRSAGTQLQINGTNILEVSQITLPQQQSDTIDVTDLSIVDRHKRFIPSWVDAGECTFECFFNNSAEHMNIFALLQSGTEVAVNVILPAALGVSVSFTGLVTSVGSDITTDDAIKLSVTLKVTGVVTTASVASAALTSLTVTGNAGTLAPAYSSTVRTYVYSGMTGATCVITPTLTGLVNGKFYAAGVYQQDFVSGTAITGSVPTPAPNARVFTLVYNEAGKTSVAYTVTAARTS